MKMLNILLYGNTDKEVKYAATQMLDHIGIPFKEGCNLKSLERMNDTQSVLVLPETSKIEEKDAETIRESCFSVLSSGHVPQALGPDIGCYTERLEGVYPPAVSGMLQMDNANAVPFFYDFPVIRAEKDNLRTFAEIKDGIESYPGAILGEWNKKFLAVFAPQIFKSSAYLLTGCETKLSSKMFGSTSVDKQDENHGKRSDINKEDFLEIPIVNVYEELLLQALVEISKRSKAALVHKWFFPRNRSMALCLTHDVDCVTASLEGGQEALISLMAGRALEGLAKTFLATIAIMSDLLCKVHISRSRNSLSLVPESMVKELMRFSPCLGFEKYIEVERRLDGKSSFYFLLNSTCNDSDYHFQDPFIMEIIHSVERNGCEVGLHASFGSSDNERKIREEKALLEKALGSKVIGVRQHFLRLAIPETWRYQEGAGLTYDTTLGLANTVGFRSGICFPFKLWDVKERKMMSILEIPLIIMDRALFTKKYMALSPEQAFRICQRFANLVHRYHGVLTLLWHPHTTFVNRKSKESWVDFYERILSDCLRYDPWFINGKELAEWWNLRSAISFEESKCEERELKFSINSPENRDSFSLRVFIPFGLDEIKPVVNGEELTARDVIRDEKWLLFCFNLLKGRNNIGIDL